MDGHRKDPTRKLWRSINSKFDMLLHIRGPLLPDEAGKVKWAAHGDCDTPAFKEVMEQPPRIIWSRR